MSEACMLLGNVVYLRRVINPRKLAACLSRARRAGVLMHLDASMDVV
jgi:hypothetical protein